MAIKIKHRFINRLSSAHEDFSFINTIVIGTFNPGLPDKSILTGDEQKQFQAIELTDKFRKFNSVMNFYDRGPNRFWGIMDRVCNADFYLANGFEAKNRNGLKYFVGCDRAATFQRQQTFCKQAGLFITDFVKEISPNSFDKIYDKFPDIQVERSNPVWNTTEIITAIQKFNPKKVLINFSIESKSIPRITSQAMQIKKAFPKITFSVPSTSGARANKYRPLLDEWEKHIYFKGTVLQNETTQHRTLNK